MFHFLFVKDKYKSAYKSPCWICKESSDITTQKLACGHTIHRGCLKDQLHAIEQWEGGTTLPVGLVQCGLCRSWLSRTRTAGHLNALYKRFRYLAKYRTPSEEIAKCKDCRKLITVAKTNCSDENQVNDIVCRGCAIKCPTHGQDHVIYKCRFCCSPAVWRCNSIGLLCQSCHNTSPRDPKPCDCGLPHPTNGSFELHMLSCALCSSI